ncbi:hypothetical protein ACFQ1S_37690, partial [Kibdelosporangium lantanae]
DPVCGIPVTDPAKAGEVWVDGTTTRPAANPGCLLKQLSGTVQVIVAGRLAGAARNDEQLTLDVPSDGGVESVKDVLNQLESVDVASFSVRTPDLDDVFFALTGRQEMVAVKR